MCLLELQNSFLTENVSVHSLACLSSSSISSIGTSTTWSDGGIGGEPKWLPGKTFFYKFVADRPWSYFYYGNYGSIQVALPEQALLHDDYEITIILNDWCHEECRCK
ncbi:hypothetical protein MKW92_043356 [Papaver armeniacum]|nr:hypothetical protein MKW92_043356 [Papaver armeniacum]